MHNYPKKNGQDRMLKKGKRKESNFCFFFFKFFELHLFDIYVGMKRELI